MQIAPTAKTTNLFARTAEGCATSTSKVSLDNADGLAAPKIPGSYEAGRLLADALDVFYDAAARETDELIEQLDELLLTEPGRSAGGWSIRVSEDGLELMDVPLERWMGSSEWSSAGFYDDFSEGERLDAVRDLLADNRQTFVKLMAHYQLLPWGFSNPHLHEELKNAFRILRARQKQGKLLEEAGT
jgi:hypothetical protein